MDHSAIKWHAAATRLIILFCCLMVPDVFCQNAGEKGTVETQALNSGLLKASEQVNEKAVVDLLRQGANANAEDSRGWTPLIYAAQTGNVAIVRKLIDAGANVNHRTSTTRGSTTLCFAVGGGNTNVIQVLLDRGADINGMSRDGMTPLFFAANKGWLNLVEFLLAKGADVDLFGFVDSRGGTWNALIGAVDKGHMDVVRVLIKHGANGNATNNMCLTALMEVAKRPQPEAVKLLIESGANVNAKGPKGHTALILAAYNGRTENVRLLLDAGADIFAMANDDYDPSGKSKFNAGAIAYQRGHKEISKMIQEAAIKRLSK